MYVNLLPLDYQRGRLIHRRLRQWSVVWMATLAVMAAIAWNHHVDYGKMSSKLAILREEYEPLKQMDKENRVLRDELKDIELREAIMLRLAVRRPVLTLLGAISSAARTCKGQVSVSTLVLAAPDSQNGQHHGEHGFSVVTLQGIADRDAAISRFAEGLRDQGIFEGVLLKKTQAVDLSGMQVRDYCIECRY